MVSREWDNNYGRDPLVFYAPDEICIVASGTQDETLDARHQRVRDEHNARLTQLVNGTGAPHEVLTAFGLPATLHADFTPAQETFDFLHAKAGENTHVLTALDATSAHRPHWVQLPDAKGEDGAAVPDMSLHYFGIGDDTDRARPVTERTRRVRDLVLLSNLHARHNNVAARAVPNWLAAASGYSCPSPGSAPAWVLPAQVPTEEGYWSFTFPREVVANAAQHGREEHDSKIVVAVLDTSPTAEAVQAAAHDPRHSHNLLLHHVANDPNVTINSHLPHPFPSRAHLDHVRANWRDQSLDAQGAPLPEPSFRMDDHGLFITGIIHDIAPHARVHLIRVLNGFGVTDHHAMIAALAQLPDLLQDDTQRLIVNISLGFAIPPGIEILRWWMSDTYARLEAQFGASVTLDQALDALAKDAPDTHAQLQAILDDLHAGLQDITDWLKANPQVLMVAAAGNDNRFFGSRGIRPEPRWPARYDDVLGVAAVGRKGPADYSNRGDVAIIGNGVATFGGNATREGDGDLGKIDTGVPPVDAIAGIYSADALTLGAGTNETGWVYWSGTSFATPIITGLAADLWDMRLAEHRANPSEASFGPQELIHELVTTFISEPRDDVDPDTLSTPTLEAEQKWVAAWKGHS